MQQFSPTNGVSLLIVSSRMTTSSSSSSSMSETVLESTDCDLSPATAAAAAGLPFFTPSCDAADEARLSLSVTPVDDPAAVPDAFLSFKLPSLLGFGAVTRIVKSQKDTRPSPCSTHWFSAPSACVSTLTSKFSSDVAMVVGTGRPTEGAGYGTVAVLLLAAVFAVFDSAADPLAFWLSDAVTLPPSLLAPTLLPPPTPFASADKLRSVCSTRAAAALRVLDADPGRLSL